MRRFVLVALAAATGWLVSVPGVGAAERVLASEARPFSVAAYGNSVAWSSYSKRSRTFRLRLRTGSRTTTPRVPAQKVPFDVDLAPARDGRLVLLYSRCRNRNGPCERDIFEYSPKTRREEPVRSARRTGVAESHPQGWRGRLAFLTKRRGASTALKLATSTRRSVSISSLPPRAGYETYSGPSSIGFDLRGPRLVAAWSSTVSFCPDGGEPAPKIDPEYTELVDYDLESGRRRRVDGGCTGQDPLGVDTPLLDASELVYQRRVATGSTDPDQPAVTRHLLRLDAQTGRSVDAPLSSETLAVAVAEDRFYEVRVDRSAGDAPSALLIESSAD